MSPIIAGVTYADDFVHEPSHHLLSHRLTNYVELGFWQTVFGERYLYGWRPKIVACAYTALLCLIIRGQLTASGISRVTATAVAAIIPTHPLWNVFVLWNVCGVYVLSLALIIGGYWCLSRATARGTVVGVFLLFAGISSYQIHVGILPALVFLELTLATGPRRKRLMLAINRLSAVGGALALYVLSSSVLNAVGFKPWGDRGIAELNVAGWVRQIQPMTDNLATLTQPLLSFYGSQPISWKFWWTPYLVLATAVCLSLLIRGRRPLRALLLAAAVIVLPVLAAAMILPLNVQPTGARVAAPIWLSLLFALVPACDIPAGRRFRALLVATASAFAVLALIVSCSESRSWTRAWEADIDTVDRIRGYWTARQIALEDVTIVIPRESLLVPPIAAWKARPIVLQNFKAVTPWDHSNVICCPAMFFPAYGFGSVREDAEGSLPSNAGAAQSSALATWVNDLEQRKTTIVRHRDAPDR